MARRNARRPKRRNPTGLFILILAGIAGMAFLYPLRHAERSATQHASPTVQPSRDLPARSPERIAVPSPALASPSPLETNAAPASSGKPVAGDHRLAIIIDDCGQWPATERALIALPIALTLSVMPKERYTETIAREAAAAGKGVMLHLPMEPSGGADPGRGKITTAMTDSQITEQVKEDIAAVPLAKGVNNHEGSKATSDSRVMNDVIAVLAPMNLFFIDSRTSAQTVAAQAASAAGMRTASRDVFLDNVDDAGAVAAKLREAAGDAERNGSAIAIGHPRAATLAAITAMIPELQRQGITFVLASDLAK